MMNEPHNCNPYLLRSTVLQLRTEDQEAELIRIRCEVILQQRLWQLQHQQLQQDNQLLLMSLLQAGAAHAHTATQLQQLTQSSRLDTLTQTLNRSIMLDRIQQAISLAKRQHSIFALLFIDLNKFKPINDQHGHAAGDKVLIAFAELCKQSIRDTDLAGRYGGEEFFILLPEVDIKTAIMSAERIRLAVAEHEFVLTSGDVLHITCSIGIAMYMPLQDDLDKLLLRADQALYQAKHQGRNRCAVMQ